MCGIVAVAGKIGTDEVQRVLRRLRHRGPDGMGAAQFPEAALGHRRLAIVDPAGGAQPLWNEDASLALVCNGEIYNALDLRRRLAAGHAFATRSDSEVVLHLFEERGLAGLKELSGMYAFALAGPGRFLAGRDPVGIKPLYMARDGHAIWLSSEIAPLQVATTGNIAPVPPGCAVDAAGTILPIHPLRFPDPEPRALPNVHARIRAAVQRAVETHLMADVPIGAFLSGGLDSTLIVALARRALGSLRTFSTGLAGSADLAWAREAAAVLETRHEELVITEADILNELPSIVGALENYDRDLVRSAIPTWFVSRLAATHLKVVLTGEGADELFAGYEYLADWREPEDLQGELARLIRSLHHLNLQRVDRMTMHHGLEARVPFLDLGVIDAAMEVDPRLKMVRPDLPAKAVLRMAFEGLVPDRWLWREKAQFDEGAGIATLMPGLAKGRAGLAKEQLEAAAAGVPPPRDDEEAWYFRLFRHRLDPARVRATLGRWVPTTPPAPVPRSSRSA